MSENNHAKMLGRYIVADPKICHGKPTFRGTRIMVWQVFEMLEDGLTLDDIVRNFPNGVPKEALAEAIRLSGAAFVKHWDDFVVEVASQ